MTNPNQLTEEIEAFNHLADEIVNFNLHRYDIKWNSDCSRFNAFKLLWWDDASYSRYQGDESDYEPSDEEKAEFYRLNPNFKAEQAAEEALRKQAEANEFERLYGDIQF